jgi:hypothetical protein
MYQATSHLCGRHCICLVGLLCCHGCATYCVIIDGDMNNVPMTTDIPNSPWVCMNKMVVLGFQFMSR